MRILPVGGVFEKPNKTRRTGPNFGTKLSQTKVALAHGIHVLNTPIHLVKGQLS